MKPIQLGLLILIIAGAFGAVVLQHNRWQNLAEKEFAARSRQEPIAMGNTEGKVKVEAIIPSARDCHVTTVAMLNALVKEEPERTRVEISDMFIPLGKEAMKKRGVECAAIFVNGKSQFTVERDGQPQTVRFEKNPNTEESSYHTVDIVAAVDQELIQAYGTGLTPEARETLLQAQPGGAGKAASADPQEVFAALGPPKQPLAIETVYPLPPLGMGKFFVPTQKWLKALVETYPDQVTLEEYYIPSPEAQDRMFKWDSPPGAIAINGITRHTISEGGKSRTVELFLDNQNMRLTYDLDDLQAVLTHYIQAEAPEE